MPIRRPSSGSRGEPSRTTWIASREAPVVGRRRMITAVYGGSGVREMGGCTAHILQPRSVRLCAVDFKSAYAHGFARVAACTVPIALADPATNAETVLTEARECHDEGVAVAVFSELCLTGYSVDDLFLQDTLLEAVERAIGTIVEASATCVRCSSSARRCARATGSTTARWSSTAARCSGWRPSRSCRPTGSSTRPAGSPRVRTSAARSSTWAARACRSAAT